MRRGREEKRCRGREEERCRGREEGRWIVGAEERRRGGREERIGRWRRGPTLKKSKSISGILGWVLTFLDPKF